MRLLSAKQGLIQLRIVGYAQYLLVPPIEKSCMPDQGPKNRTETSLVTTSNERENYREKLA